MNDIGDLVECIASDLELDLFVRKPVRGKIYEVYEPPKNWTIFDKLEKTCIKLHDGHLYSFDNSFFRNISRERDNKINKLLN